MTSIALTCPFCEATIHATQKVAGKQVKCPRCEMEFTAELPTSVPDAAAQSPPRRNPYEESKHTESSFLKSGAQISSQIASQDFGFTDLVAAFLQGLSAIAAVISFGMLMIFPFVAALSDVVVALWGVISSLSFFVTMGAIRAVIHIARRA